MLKALIIVYVIVVCLVSLYYDNAYDKCLLTHSVDVCYTTLNH